MKKTGFIAIALALFSLSFTNTETVKYSVDKDNSSVKWTGNRIGGSSHEGTIDVKSGEMLFSNGSLVGGTFVIDMSTINTTDLTGGRKERLDGHLKNEDFFDVTKFPTATLVIKTVENTSAGRVRISGDITIKNITRPITFPASVAIVNDRVVASATLTFDRSDFDVRFGSNRFFDNLGDRAINNDIPLVINIVATRGQGT